VVYFLLCFTFLGLIIFNSIKWTQTYHPSFSFNQHQSSLPQHAPYLFKQRHFFVFWPFFSFFIWRLSQSSLIIFVLATYKKQTLLHWLFFLRISEYIYICAIRHKIRYSVKYIRFLISPSILTIFFYNLKIICTAFFFGL